MNKYKINLLLCIPYSAKVKPTPKGVVFKLWTLLALHGKQYKVKSINLL